LENLGKLALSGIFPFSISWNNKYITIEFFLQKNAGIITKPPLLNVSKIAEASSSEGLTGGLNAISIGGLDPNDISFRDQCRRKENRIMVPS